MYTNIKTAIRNGRKRRMDAQLQKNLTRSLDAHALSEFGYPVDRLDTRRRRWLPCV